MDINNEILHSVDQLRELLEKFDLSIDDLDDIEVLTACTGTCLRTCGGG